MSAASISEMFAMLNSVDVDVDSQKGEHISLDHLLQFGQATDELRKYSAATEVWLNVCKMRIMLCENFMCRYLHGFGVIKLRNTLQDPDRPPQHWLEHLAWDVLRALEERRIIDITSDKYLDTTLLTSVTYRPGPQTRRPIVPSREEAIELTIVHVTALLGQWFHVPDSFTTRARSCLVDCIMDAGMPALLLMPEVWTVYETMPRWIFHGTKPQVKNSARRRVEFRPEYLDDFGVALKQSALAQPSSPEHMLLDSLRAAYRGLVSNVTGAGDLSGRRSPSTRLHIIDPTFDPNDALSTVTSTRHRAQEQFVQFLHEALAAAEHNFHPHAVTENSDLYTTLCENADFLLPLRSLAPSCGRINGRMGDGITSDFARTDAGLFSALVFRGITFNTVALRELALQALQVEFHDDRDFASYLLLLEAVYTSAEICNPNAMSSQPTGRHKVNYKAFWEAASESAWSDLFEGREQIPFVEAQQWIKKLKGKRSIPGLGDLGLYLLLADLCDIGVVAMPGVDEMGGIVYSLDLGAMAGLRLLHYLPDTVRSKDGVQAAFATFYADVESSLTASERDRMVWNPITAEHSLCKYKRMCNKGILQGQHLHTTLCAPPLIIQRSISDTATVVSR